MKVAEHSHFKVALIDCILFCARCYIDVCMGKKVARAYPPSMRAHKLTHIRANALTIFKEVRLVLAKRDDHVTD